MKGILKAKLKGHEDELINEVSTWKCLSGSLNVVQLHGVYEDYYNVYLLMELCTGIDFMVLCSCFTLNTPT